MIRIIINKRGIALITVYMIIMALLVLAGAYYWRSFNESRFAQRERDQTKAYYIAEAGLAQVAMDIYQIFGPLADQSWMNDTYENDFRSVIENYPFPVTINTPEGLTCTVMVPANTDPVVVTPDGVLLKLIAVGTAPHLGGTARKAIASTISYEMKQSPVFNYAYFINNFGELGMRVTVNGDVRSNADFSFAHEPLINGDIYAAENPDLEAAGTISGDTTYWDISEYQSNAPPRARPTDPTGPPNPGGEVYDAGYDGESERFEHQNVLDMPYLGDLGDYLGTKNGYRRLAEATNGKITGYDEEGKKKVYEKFYEGDGPDGEDGTPDDGCIVLIGTKKKPIVIEGRDADGNPIPGVVVIKKDVIIKGVVSGQGAIYAGRNIHILGDVTYKDPPSWPKPDEDPYTTAGENKTKDFLGFGAKGNVVIGNYTRGWWKLTLEYLTVDGYEVDETDAALGYDSDQDPDNGYWFDGNYTAVDDEEGKDDGEGEGIERRFYESSLSDSDIDKIAGKRVKITHIDGVFYNNHAFAGRVRRCAFDGSIVSRNEAIVYSPAARNGLIMNYDVRAHRGNMDYIDINLPRSLVLPETRARQSG